MAGSPVEICNQALSWLGANLIISLDDNSVEAKLCKANYEPIRDTVLEDREWTFAVKRLEPVQLLDIPLYGYSKAFQIPPEVIRVLQVSLGGEPGVEHSSFRSTSRGGTGMGRETRVDWSREGDQILANNASRLFMRCLVRITDTNKFTPAFTQCLAARLATDLAVPITNSLKVQQAMAGLYDSKLANAFATDGMQGRSYNVRSDAFINVR